jgi:hypothetical protein
MKISADECNSNGVVFSKGAIEEALRNMRDTPIYYKDSGEDIGYPIGRIERGAYAMRFTKDGDIQFTFQDEDFFITAGEDGPFIDIWEYNWMQVSLNEVYKVSKLRQAINDINSIGDIATTYSVNKECHEFHVHCGAKILFYSYIPNRRGYLQYVLMRFSDTHRPLEDQFLKITREEIPPEEVVN